AAVWCPSSALVLAVALGCSGSAAVGRVSGKVLLKDGTPLPGGIVKFVAADAQFATGEIKPDGSYEVRNVPVGAVKIVVDTERLNPNITAPAAMKGRNPPKDVLGSMGPPKDAMKDKSPPASG